jgi:DNA-binding CsgD family transcriptional regulator
MSSSPYHAATQRTFRQAIIHLLENEYKLLGSHRVIQMIADDIAELQAEYYRDVDKVPPGHIVWHGTLDTGHKPKVGRAVEDEPTVTAVLPLITDNDIAERAQGCPAGKHPATWARDRSIRRMVRLVKAGLDNSGGRQLLSQAELALLLNRSITTVAGYIEDHYERTGEFLPIKGYVLDLGSKPTHKGQILQLYEQGMAPPDIARATNHSLEAVDRYIKDYERVKVLLSKELTVAEISHTIGRGERTVIEYRDIARKFHPELAVADQG